MTEVSKNLGQPSARPRTMTEVVSSCHHGRALDDDDVVRRVRTAGIGTLA
jgi:hypothetical protein